MQSPSNSSILSIPPLHFSDSPDRASGATQLKQRATSRFSITDMLELPTITEVPSDRFSTGDSLITLNQIQTLRRLKLPALEEMSEEQCMAKLSKNPFFCRKVQSQLKSLSKSCSLVSLPQRYKENDPLAIEGTMKLIDDDGAITYRKVKECETLGQLEEKKRYEYLMRETELKERRANKGGKK